MAAGGGQPTGRRKFSDFGAAPLLFAPLGVAAVLAILAGSASAATSVPAAALSSDTVWSTAGSPYTLEGGVTVPSGINLTVDAGVTIRGRSTASLVVEGGLDIFGTTSSLVRVEPATAASFWDCLTVQGAGRATLRNASIEYCTTGLTIKTNGSVEGSDLAFNHSLGQAVLVSGDTGGVRLVGVRSFDAVIGLRAQDGRANLFADRLNFTQSVTCLQSSSASNLTVQQSAFHSCGNFSVDLVLSANVVVRQSVMDEYSTAAVSAVSVDRLTVSTNDMKSVFATYGVRFIGVSNSTIEFNQVRINPLPEGALFIDLPVGIYDFSPLGPNTLRGNNVSEYSVGILVERAVFPQTILSNVILKGPDTGLEILDSPNQTLSGNAISGRSYPFAVNVTSPGTPWYYRQYVDNTNTVNGRPIVYLVDRVGESYNATLAAGVLAVVDSNNLTFEGANLTLGVPSLLVVNSRDITVRDSRVQSEANGAMLIRATRVRLENVSFNTSYNCMVLRDGRDNAVEGAALTRCIQGVLTEGTEANLLVAGLNAIRNAAVAFFQGSNLTLRDSYFEGLTSAAVTNSAVRVSRGGQVTVRVGVPVGISLDNVTIADTSQAIWFENISNVVMRKVTVVGATTAIELRGVSSFLLNASNLSGVWYGLQGINIADGVIEDSRFEGALIRGVNCGCTDVTIVYNWFAGDGLGLALNGGSGSRAHHNWFFYNSLHAASNTSAHEWDDGAAGNFWDDYTGVDGDSDGIGDTPYPISGGFDSDRHPIVRFPDDLPPVANAGPDILGYEDAPVLFNGYFSTDDVGIFVYLWSFVDGGVKVTVSGHSVRYIFKTPGVYNVTLTVIDWGGNRATDWLIVTILDRTPPVAYAGGDRAVDEDTPVILNGRNSFDNDPTFPVGAVFTWYVFDRNGTFTLFGPVVTWTFATPGNYSVVLVVDDASGYTGQDRAVIRVRDRTPPVVPAIGPPIAVEDFPFRVYASVPTDNDPEFPNGSVAWFELWLGAVRIGISNSSPGVFNVSDPGVYKVLYLVSDAAGNVGSAAVNFTVLDTTPPDVSAFGDLQGEAGIPKRLDALVAFDNNLLWPEGANATWATFILGSPVTLYGLQVEIIFPARGDYPLTIEIRDAAGNTASKRVLVHVVDSLPPTVSITGPSLAEAGQPATFEATAQDASALGEYSWTVAGLTGARQGKVFTNVFRVPGSYQVNVSVEDELGHVGVAHFTVVVLDTTAPTVRLGLAPDNGSGPIVILAGETLQGTFLGVDHVGVAQVVWSWGDGRTSTGLIVTVNWTVPGNYTVLVRVTDAAGNANSTSFLVRVLPQESVLPPPPPPNGTSPTPTGGGFAAEAVVGLVLAAAVAGVGAGFVLARSRKRPRV